MLEPEAEDFNRDWLSKPADSLLGVMRRRGISVEAAAEVLEGGMETIRGLVTGTKAIDVALARTISTFVGGSVAFWLNRQAKYDRALDLALHKAFAEADDWLDYVPAPESIRRKRLSKEEKASELRKRLAFYDVSTLAAWYARYVQTRHQTQFRTSLVLSSNAGSESLWLRLGELEAALTTTNRWNPTKLLASLSDILKLSKIHQPTRFLPKLKALGAEAGVAIVAIRAPEGCRASGASKLLSADKALILLSFRHRTDDHFWFTLLHECGHLLLHGAKPFVDSDDLDLDDNEREANEFASSCIIPAHRWEEFANLRYDRNSILRFSVSLGIAPGLIVGQLQHRGAVPRDRLNFLKRRWTWAEIEEALS